LCLLQNGHAFFGHSDDRYFHCNECCLISAS
jgi:hypothetical protein